VNIFFDVDHTLIDSGNRLRPGVRELFTRLTADGHRIYLWSGIGERSEVVTQHQLAPYVTACYVKPLYQHRRMLEPLGIAVNPDFVVDDHPDLPAVFGGVVVRSFLRYDAGDREMERVYAAVAARAT
jgi:phosphoglycolate phosphatase-like HAD superfamily hydrolase